MDPADASFWQRAHRSGRGAAGRRCRCPTSTRRSPRRSTSATTSRAPGTISRTRRPTWSSSTTRRLPDVRLETSYRGSGLGGTQFLRDRRISRRRSPARAIAASATRSARSFTQRLPDVEPRRDGELSARPQLRGGEPGAGRGRAPAGRAAHRQPAAAGGRNGAPGGAADAAAPPNASTRRAPAQRWRSSVSTPSSGATTSGCRRRSSSRRRSAICCRRR